VAEEKKLTPAEGGGAASLALSPVAQRARRAARAPICRKHAANRRSLAGAPRARVGARRGRAGWRIWAVGAERTPSAPSFLSLCPSGSSRSSVRPSAPRGDQRLEVSLLPRLPRRGEGQEGSGERPRRLTSRRFVVVLSPKREGLVPSKLQEDSVWEGRPRVRGGAVCLHRKEMRGGQGGREREGRREPTCFERAAAASRLRRSPLSAVPPPAPLSSCAVALFHVWNLET
jgi:hypothetical protein